MERMKVRIVFEEELLGTAPNNPEVYREFIAANAPDAPSREEEIESVGVDEVAAKGKTVFPRNADGVPHLWDYQIKGFFKDACGMLTRVAGTKSKELKAYKKNIDGLIFVYPREIPIIIPDGKKIGECQRPLRAQTAQGERVSLSCSDSAPAGTSIEFEVECLDKKLEKVVVEWLEYGAKRGLGQWRNSGKGRFSASYERE
jgi:hypothetical protein